MANLWANYGQTMAKLCPSYGYVMTKLWLCYGQTMAKLWPNYGKVMAKLCQSYGQTGQVIALLWGWVMLNNFLQPYLMPIWPVKKYNLVCLFQLVLKM